MSDVASERDAHHDARPANARLCHVIKSDSFDGYGFNLHAEKGKPGQYIGKVDEGSPAELAGLRQGDRILEVNGVSIRNENHKQVVQRIKTLPGETRLLVVDPDDDDGEATEAAAAEAETAVANNGSAPAAVTASAGNGHGAHDAHDANGTSQALNLSMTAAELRARLAAKKKFDPRKESIDFKKKFDVVQKL